MQVVWCSVERETRLTVTGMEPAIESDVIKRCSGSACVYFSVI